MLSNFFIFLYTWNILAKPLHFTKSSVLHYKLEVNKIPSLLDYKKIFLVHAHNTSIAVT